MPDISTENGKAPSPVVESESKALTAPIEGGATGAGFRKGYDPNRGVGRPGFGRPASAVRAAARLGFAERIDLLCAIADGAPLPHTRRVIARAGKRLPDGTVCTPEQAAEGTVIEVHWEESADLDQRMKAVKMLGEFGGLASTSIVDDNGNSVFKPVYEVTFD